MGRREQRLRQAARQRSGESARERVTRAIFVAVGWVFPVATAWLAIEMWNDWRAFRGHGSRVSLDSQADARVTAVLIVGPGLAALWLWATVVRGRHGSRRRAVRSSLG